MGIFEKIEKMNEPVETDSKNDVTRVTTGRNTTLTIQKYREKDGDKQGGKSVTTEVTTGVTTPALTENDVNRPKEGASRKQDRNGDNENNFSKQKFDTAQTQEIFKAGYTWIKPRLPELLAAGWTRPELFQRAKYSWPMGSWGVAWLSIWAEPDVKATIGKHGEIVFEIQRQGRPIKQTAWPKGKRKI
ncbi:MAG: hypothetical protein ACYSUX_18960 [Planctomycetota bacterium]|jgi:hypothetical protein